VTAESVTIFTDVIYNPSQKVACARVTAELVTIFLSANPWKLKEPEPMHKSLIGLSSLFLVGLISLGLLSARTARQQTGTASAMTKAAQAFVESLDDQQRKAAQLAYDTPQRVDWHFTPLRSFLGIKCQSTRCGVS